MRSLVLFCLLAVFLVGCGQGEYEAERERERIEANDANPPNDAPESKPREPGATDNDEAEVRIPSGPEDEPPSEGEAEEIVQEEPTITDMIAEQSDKYGVPYDLAMAIAMVESRLNPAAVREELHLNDASIGVFQVLGETARWFCGIDDPEELFDPQTNIKCGVSYLAWQLARYGNEEKAIVAYNAGSVVWCKTKRQQRKFGCTKWDYLNRGYLEKVKRILKRDLQLTNI